MNRKILFVIVAIISLTIFANAPSFGEGPPEGKPPRFILMDGGETFLDLETRLIWEVNPTGVMNWESAVDHCVYLDTGGHSDWRLPDIEELLSLVDYSQSGPAVPPDFPGNIDNYWPYWAVTTLASNSGLAWYVYFPNGDSRFEYKDRNRFAWCVRGSKK